MSEEHDRLMRTVKDVVDDAGDLHQKLQFTRATDALKQRRSQISDLAGRINQLRAKGYLYKKGLEGRLEEAQRLAPEATQELLRESRATGDRLRDRIEGLANRARPLVHDSDLTDRKDQIDMLEDEKRDLEREVRDAERRVEAISEPVVKAVDEVAKGVKDAEGVLESFASASFQLEAAEEPVAVGGASWEDAPGGAQNGKIYLTQSRLRFEQDEVIKKGGFLGFGAEKTQVKELRIDEPIGHLASSDDSTRGWVFKDQVLAFQWSSKAKVRGTTTFEMASGSAKTWDTLVESLRDGSIAADRVEGSQSTPLPQFASDCSACGGQLPAAVRGQHTLSCPFCGTVNQPIA